MSRQLGQQARKKIIHNNRSTQKAAKKSQSYLIDSKEESESSSQTQTQSQGLSANHFQSSEYNQACRLMKSCRSKPSQSLKALLRHYQRYSWIYYQPTKCRKYCQFESVRLLFIFVRKIIENSEEFPFFQREKTIIIFEDLLKILKQKKYNLTFQQIKQFEQTTNIIWTKMYKKQEDRIIVNGLSYFLKITILLGDSFYKENAQLCIKLIEINLKKLLILCEKSPDKNSPCKSLLLSFFEQSFDMLSHIQNCYEVIFPLFDIIVLSLTSISREVYSKMIEIMFASLKLGFEDKRQENLLEEGNTVEENERTIKMLLTACNLFNFKSVFAVDTESYFANEVYYSKEVVFLVLLMYKSHFLKLVDQLEKIERTSVSKRVVRFMFQMALIGININRTPQLKEIISNIMQISELKQHLYSQHVAGSMKKVQVQSDSLENLLKYTQKSLFDLLYRIQKVLCHYDFQLYMDLYIQSPFTFRSEYFIQNLFKLQSMEIILSFMISFTKRWILDEVRPFDFNFYLEYFLKKCVGKDTIVLIGSFIKQLSVEELLKINLILFKFSFQEDKKKYGIPESSDFKIQLAHLTSVGFADKYLFINKILPDFSEQLVWKEMINAFYPSNYYLFVKAFYNVANYQLTFHENNMPKIIQIIECFQASLAKQKAEEVYSIFHLIACISFKDKDTDSRQQENRLLCQKRLFQFIIDKAENIINLCTMVCERRRSAMNHIVLSSQLVNENMKYFQKIKRMHNFFLRIMIRWMDRLQNVHMMVNQAKRYEQIIEICCKLSKDVEFNQHHLVRILSNYCSEKYFSNLLQNKIKGKLMAKEIMLTHYLTTLREILYNLLGKYPLQNQPNDYCVKQMEIIVYFESILCLKLTASTQREVLKQKIIVLDIFLELTTFFNKFPSHYLKQQFHDFYETNFRKVIIEIATQNPALVSKYQRQLIIHLRTTAICHIILFFESSYKILSKEDFFSFIYELCFDRLIEIRFLVLNLMISRFKNEKFKRFLANKYQITAFLTLYAIFQPHPILKHTSKRVLQTIKKSGDDTCCLGLIILLYIMKLMLQNIFNGLLRDEYNIFFDYFLNNFDSLWLSKKQWEYSVYGFCQKYLEENNCIFMINELSYKSFLQCYITAREKSDYIVEREIKEYLRKDFSFEFPPEESQPKPKDKDISDVIASLSNRICKKLKVIIMGKSRGTRILRSKKDINIQWKFFQKQGIIRQQNNLQGGEKIKFSLS